VSSSFDRSGVPKLAPGCDLTRLPIDAREGFLLSRVDGATSLGDIAVMTGFGLDEVERAFEKFVGLRAAYFGDTPPESESKPEERKPEERKPEERKPERASVPPTRASTPRLRRTRGWTATDLDEPADLDLASKERILDLFHALDDLDHYELLGVGRAADRKEIKGAYYKLAAAFHTDRYFGKNLGSFKAKMEQIFGRITVAHDTLANRQRREEYDAYLVDRDRTRAFERYLAGEDDAESPVEPSRGPGPGAAPSATTTATTTAAAPVEVVGRSVPTPVAAPAASPEEVQRLRREALAKRLAGASSGRLRAVGASRSSVPPPVPSVPSPEQASNATETLRRRYEETRDFSRRVAVERLSSAAEEAVASGDLVAAANHYRAALRFGDDADVAAKYEDVSRRAREQMAESYLKQARYEEQSQRWAAAALSYLKAHEGQHDDPEIAERAAHALRMEGRDLHKAARMAELAVQKVPTSARFRGTLGAVYLDAGLFLRARSELEQAAKLDPSDAQLKELLARARKMAS
jgi:curved DNA-binding protein CbpA